MLFAGSIVAERQADEENLCILEFVKPPQSRDSAH